MIEKYGICLLGLIPLRSEPSHKSEMVTQLLFGESFTILEEVDNWVKISIFFDAYEGWISRNCFQSIDKSAFLKNNAAPQWVCCELFSKIKNVDNSDVFFIPGGSIIYNYKDEDMSFNILNNWYQFIERPKLRNCAGTGNISKTALRYIHAPYLWGGRTAMGIDCSGFTQVVYKILGFIIPRDASQQINLGETINFLAEAQEGDLAFFDNDEGQIIHVGILLSSNEIIHSSGKVSIDAIDQTGIYSRELKNYSHRLRLIKRIII